ncbi:MAG TPA: hypothetical protein VOA80_03725, partial [Thermoanaerobaculia bacterium]|nr:hypothetical protein [Thermoanaerobaculia bacterium]
METLLDRPASDAAPAAPLPLGAAVSQPLGAVVSWPLAAAVLGTTAVVAGLLWDISWHASIGRDTFWTPAHLAIYLGGLLCGLSAGWLALSTTFAGTPAQRGMAVGFWGFRAPLGAWVAIWGSIAMLTSAPFDNWWHDAYGLDVKIISPPHLLLAAGVLAMQLGAMLQALAAQNRQGGPYGRVGESAPPEKSGEAGSRLAWIYAYAGGLLLTLVSTIFLEYNEPNKQHGALFYEICCAAYPLILVGVARGSRLRWPATTVAGIFMAVRLAMTWLLPLFPATPKLAPIYNPVHHLWPPYFPELLIVPAVALDLLLRRAGRPGGALAPRDDAGHPGRRAALALVLSLAVGAVFFALLLAVQWSFSELLMSPYARNWFFAADQWTYRAHPGARRYRYWLEGDAFGPRAAALSLLLAAASARLGL